MLRNVRSCEMSEKFKQTNKKRVLFPLFRSKTEHIFTASMVTMFARWRTYIYIYMICAVYSVASDWLRGVLLICICVKMQPSKHNLNKNKGQGVFSMKNC